SCFGYNNLVVDYRGMAIMKSFGAPVVFDATHSVQLPGAGDGCSQGERIYAPMLASASLTLGIAALFMETHPDPSKALSDGPNSIPLREMQKHLSSFCKIDKLIKQ
ncbi:MAG: 3-deoxy-8-phosphooctulonate synthase, partial [Pseudomonadota bacterium]|nr:3-deoxy-8-phosphooctulonate synthase [Pseudomonadota bacterium]